MKPEIIGQISLNIAAVIYLFFLVPQIWHNIKYKSTGHLSFLSHCIFFLAYLMDLGYGFGFGLQWQYKTVSIIGIIALSVQHFQIYSQAKEQNHKIPRFFKEITVFYLLLLIFIISGLYFQFLNQIIFNIFGILAMCSWLSFTLPQIVKNYRIKSILGFSVIALIMSILATTCDTVSAWALDWPIPSKIGAPLSTFFKLILLSQYSIYSAKLIHLKEETESQ